MKRRRAFISWSSGKDCAWALHAVRQQGELEVAGLLCSVNAQFRRVSMHGVRQQLLEQQAQAAGLPLLIVELPWPCPNEEYERRMADACARLRALDVEVLVFGDLFLADVRQYREKQLAGTGIEPVFPLWGFDTRRLAREMLAGGLRARIACLDPKRVDRSLAGAELTAPLLEALPEGVDPCGENGEFHTFAFEGPVFSNPIRVMPGEIVERDGFVYADLLPDGPPGGG
jgi:uncharacterized protein (TIGR00290 family)